MDSLLGPKVIEHFLNPRNVGEIADADGIGTVGHPVCGDIMRIYIKIGEANGQKFIADAKFKTFGCTTAIATSSVATELIRGKSLADALKIKDADVAAALGGLPPIKMHCSVLAEDALRAAMADYQSKAGHGQMIQEVMEESRAHEEKELLSRDAD